MGLLGNIYNRFDQLITLTEKQIGDNASSIIYLLIAMSTYVLMLAWTRVHADQITPIQAQCIRGALVTGLIYLYSRHNNIPLTVANRRQDKLRILRNVIASLFNVASFFVVTRVPMSTILIVQASSPFMIAFIDHFFHKTTYTRVEIIFSFVSVFGVTFMIKPDLFLDIEVTQQVTTHSYAEGPERIFWIIFFIIATMFWSGSVVMLKAMRNMNPMAMNLPFGICLALTSPLIEITYESIKNPSAWIYVQAIFFLGIISFLNQHTYVKANQMGKPAKLGMLNNLNVVLSFLFEILYLGEHREWYSFVGAFIIVGSSIILSISRLQK